MPKLKTNSGAAKRFRKTATGFKHRKAKRSHNFTAKTTKNKRQFRANVLVNDSDVLAITRLLPYAKTGG